MQITVRSSKVAKTGESAKGKWTLYVVVDDTTGVEYTTFDGKAHTGAGAVLDIGEPEIKEGKHSFKKVVEIVKAAAAPVSGPAGHTNGMTPEAWAEKDQLERWSRECNTCFMGISQMVSSIFAQPQETRRDDIPEPLLSVYQNALKWADAHFTTKSAPAPEKPKSGAPQSKSEPPQDDVNPTLFKNPGEFYTACNKQFKVPKSIVDSEISGCDLTTDAGRLEAWGKVKAVYGEKPPDEKDGVETETTAQAEADASAAELFG